MAAPRALALKEAEVEAWCREEKSPTARKTVWNLVRGLCREGVSEPGLLWWLKEDGRVLGRLLLAREEDGLRAGLLRLPWDGAWSGSLRRLMEAAGQDARRRGLRFLRIPDEALDRLPPAFAPRIADLGFREEEMPSICHLRRTATVPPSTDEIPLGAAVDGDEGHWSPTGDEVRDLPRSLSALAAHGVVDLWLTWPLEEALVGTPPGWVLVEEGRHRSWRLELAPHN